MKLIFTRSPLIGSRIIRVLTWSKWSHVVLAFNDGWGIEATYPRVRHIDLDVLLHKHKEHAIAEIDADESKVRDFAESQIGKPYDLSAVIGLALHRDWQEDDAWFCSELVAASINAGREYPLFRPESVRRVTPELMWELSR